MAGARCRVAELEPGPMAPPLETDHPSWRTLAGWEDPLAPYAGYSVVPLKERIETDDGPAVEFWRPRGDWQNWDRSLVTGEVDYVPLALTANRHGRAVGQTVAGKPTRGGPVARTAITKVVDLEVARTGITDLEEAREYGFDPVSRTISSRSRSG